MPIGPRSQKSFKECGESLKLMKNGKSPGSDGFTVDFYKFFWNDIGAFVTSCWKKKSLSTHK
jgi:hypothetical protein